jgi:uncharacterized membrane protein
MGSAATDRLNQNGQRAMADDITVVAGIPIPSTSPVFLTIVGIHVLFGLVCTVTGVVAMASRKGRGRHSDFGTIYYWSLVGVFVTATALAAVRWAEDYHLFILGALGLAAAYWARRAARHRWRGWVRQHIAGMGVSYILMLTAFYVDNGKNLPLWKELPEWAFWILPALIGTPLIIHALVRHPLARRLV